MNINKERIKELELELFNLKSSLVAEKDSFIHFQKESEERFLTLSNHLPAYVAFVNAETLKYEFVNDLFVKSFDIPRDKIIGSHIREVIGEKNYQFALKYIEEAKTGKTTSYENSFNTTSGKRWIQVNYSPLFDSSGNVISLAVLSVDITERKHSELVLKESEELYKLSQSRYQAIFESTGTATLIVAADYTILLANHECMSLTGYSQEELIGQKWIQYVEAESLKEMVKNHNLRRSNPSLAPNKYEVKLVNRKGETRFVMLDIGMVPGTSQSIVSIIDITERLIAERAIKSKAEELERINNLMINRERKMIELKKEVNDLLTKAGESGKYRIHE